MTTTPSPPLTTSFPATIPYTPFYCEENVHQLLHSLLFLPPTPSTHRRTYALFISNLERTSFLAQQKASQRGKEQAHYVVWDYHVVAVVVVVVDGKEEEEENTGGSGVGDERGTRVEVWDRDSRLGDKVELQEYIEETFRPDLFDEGILPPSFASRIRIVPSTTFLANFASDRSHMLAPPPSPSSTDPTTTTTTTTPPSTYIHPPPSYPSLQGLEAKQRLETNNLWSRFLEMRTKEERMESGEVVDWDEEERRFGSVVDVGELGGLGW